MSQNQRERVTDILEAADRESAAVLSTDESSADGSLLEVADAASEFLEANDPQTVLEAVGLDTLPDGSEPESIPVAIARGDERELEELNRLLNLASLADDADGAVLADATDPLREHADDVAELEAETADADATDEARESSADDADGTTDEAAEADDQANGDAEGDDAADGQADEDAADDSSSILETLTDGLVDADETTEEGTADVGDALEDAVRSSVTEFGDDVGRLRDKLESARAEESADENAGEVDEDEADEKTAGDEKAGEDDGDDFLEVDLGGGRNDRSSSRGVVRHSTVAPSPSNRADMKGPVRFSTMPDKMD